MTFVLKQAENKEQLHGELPGEDSRTKKSSATRQSEKKKFIKTKFTSNNCLVPEALERAAKRKAGDSSLAQRCVLPDPTLQPWKLFQGKTSTLRVLTGLLPWGLWGRGTDCRAKSEVKTLKSRCPSILEGAQQGETMLSRIGGLPN